MGRRIVEFGDTFLPMSFAEGVHHYRIKAGMPADARIVNAHFEFPIRGGGNTVRLLIESAEWEGPADGHPYPRMDLTVEAIHKAEPGWDGP